MKKVIANTAITAILLIGCASNESAKPNLTLKESNAQAKMHFEKFKTALDKKDYDTAKKNVNIACAMDYAEACYADGQLYLHAQNYKSAKARFEKACKLNHKFGCTQLGVANVTMGNLDARLAAFEKGCDMRDGLACGSLGCLYSGAHPKLKTDVARSKTYYKLACEYGVEQSMHKVDFCELSK